MELNKILTADVLDIIFEGRNKEYGAYELRKTYQQRIKYAIGGMIAICLLVFIVNKVMALTFKKKAEVIVQDVTLADVKQEERKPEPPPPPPPPKVEPPKVEITKFTPPKIVKDEEVKEPPPAVEKLEETKIGTINQEGKKDEGVVEAPKEAVSVAAPAATEDYDKVFTSVQVESSFPGDWGKYLSRNLNAELPTENGAPPGKYAVDVTFTVDKGGNISDVTAESVSGGNDYGTKEEAMRVIRKGGKWKPGVQNGREVASRKRQRITFEVQDN